MQSPSNIKLLLKHSQKENARGDVKRKRETEREKQTTNNKQTKREEVEAKKKKNRNNEKKRSRLTLMKANGNRIEMNSLASSCVILVCAHIFYGSSRCKW